MQNAVREALSNCEVAEKIWAEPSNSFCADCGTPEPEWAAINLCVVICHQCAGPCEFGQLSFSSGSLQLELNACLF